LEIIFASNALRRCYESGTEATREWGKVVGRKYIQRIGIIYRARRFDDLYSIRSLRLHKLEGGREAEYAITLHGRWRLIVVSLEEGSVRVQEVNNHYGD